MIKYKENENDNEKNRSYKQDINSLRRRHKGKYTKIWHVSVRQCL